MKAALFFLSLVSLSLFAQEAGTVKTVAETIDGIPFDYTISRVEEKDGYKVLHLRYPSPFTSPFLCNNTIAAEYFLPSGCDETASPRPAFICLHILNGNFELARAFAVNFAEHGVPALMMMLPYYGPRRPADYRQMWESEQADEYFFAGSRQATLDLGRTFDILASRPEVDEKKIGIMGVSLGGITAARTLGQYPRFYKGALLLAGGDLERMIGHSRESSFLAQMLEGKQGPERREFLENLRAIDPVTYAGEIKEHVANGKVLMINATADEVIPRECSLALAEAMGMKANDICWIEGAGHYTALRELPNILAQVAEFATVDILDPERVQEDAISGTSSPLDLFFINLSRTVSANPAPGKMTCLKIKGEVEGRGKKRSVELILNRGAAGQFRLDAKFSDLATPIRLGRSPHLWLASGQNNVFVGDKEGDAERTALAFIHPQYMTRLQMVQGICRLAASSPGILGQLLDIEKTGADKSGVTYDILDKGRRNRLTVTLDGNGVPTRPIRFNVSGRAGMLTVLDWRIDVPVESDLFAPPKQGRKLISVAPYRLSRIFAALVNQIGYMLQ